MLVEPSEAQSDPGADSQERVPTSCRPQEFARRHLSRRAVGSPME